MVNVAFLFACILNLCYGVVGCYAMPWVGIEKVAYGSVETSFK